MTEREPVTIQEKPTPLQEVDLLYANFVSGRGAIREGSVFVAQQPWGIAYFGLVTLAPGWWAFECEGDEHANSVELRLTSGASPLLIFSGESAFGRTRAQKVFLRFATTFDVSLLLSAWPRSIAFRRLALRRCTPAENLFALLARMVRLVRTPDRLTRVGRAIRRLGSPPAVQISQQIRSPTQLTEPPRADRGDLVIQKGYRWSVRNRIGVFLGAQDRIDAEAVSIVQAAFERMPEARVIYSDAREGAEVVLRPNWNPELFKHWDFAGLPLFVRDPQFGEGKTPGQVLSEAAQLGPSAVAHLPLPLVDRPRQIYPVLPSVPPPRLATTPRVSIVIPTKYRSELLEKCLRGLASRTTYPRERIELVIVDNGSTDPRLPEILREASSKLKITTLLDTGSFNFSGLINQGVKGSSGDIVLMLNDDIEPAEESWLGRIVQSALIPDVGAVGARLTYPDGNIQHAGVVLGLGGICGHLWKHTSAEEASLSAYIVYPGQRLAVTGACLAVRREVFDRMGGLDEDYAVTLNDIDFCLRLHAAGYRNIYRGDAVLVHHESQSRGADVTPAAIDRAAREADRFLARWREMTRSDPFGFGGVDSSIEKGSPHRLVTQTLRPAN